MVGFVDSNMYKYYNQHNYFMDATMDPTQLLEKHIIIILLI